MKYEHDLGYGTNYEKLVLKRYLCDMLARSDDIHTILEFPANKLMGDTKELFENFNGKQVFSLYDFSLRGELPYDKFDLVWSFCEFENYKSSIGFLNECMELSKSKILIVTQNYFNPGIVMHRLWHALGRYKWDHGIIPKMSSITVKKCIKKNFKKKLKVLETGALDLPWFVLDIYESWAVVKDKVFGKKNSGIPSEGEIEDKIKVSFIEKNAPYFVRFLLSHSHYILLEKK
ncbi:MAG: hypothetical protein ABIH00_06295 [Armatimonadota bacterium]